MIVPILLVLLPAFAAAFGRTAHKSPVTYTTSESFWFQQRQKHFVPSDTSTFPQRWFRSASSVNSSARVVPVFLYIGGEGPLSGAPGGIIADLAAQHGALILALEHRFYGVSVPNGNLRALNLLGRLTVENALADLAAFIKSYRANHTETASAPWIIVGGSYPGALSGWFKETYPDLVDGAWSSSGVVNAIYDFTQFDTSIATAAASYTPPATDPISCDQLFRAVTAAFVHLNANDPAAARRLFPGLRTDLIDPDFFYMLADASAMGVQYSSKIKTCDAIPISSAGTVLNAVASGSWTSSAEQAVSEVTVAFARWVSDFWGADFASGCFYDTECLKNPLPPSPAVAMARAWRWQKCTELAYLQSAPAQTASPAPIRASALTLDALVEQCQVVFGAEVVLNSTAAFNRRFGGPHPQGTNVFFVDASDDPWKEASVASAPVAGSHYAMIDCDNCGHCIDLGRTASSPPQLVAVQEQLGQWVARTFAQGVRARAQ
eukprot:TRINITY_DN20629_c0_g1_i1.p1 TRINITY_DN20629_c0_g1~~TRINITY_DN20629_c0_g1_i1.p1  ORF type:complete len:492 (+),score=89.33 TRINITY_DN20629_c0_g1_i1:41-1516(+)